MEQDSFVSIIKEQTYRALWEVKSVINSVPDELWNKCYCDMPCWKHIYHMLFSLSRWFMNPRDESFQPPEFHVKDLNDLDIVSTKQLSRFDINSFYEETEVRIRKYLDQLSDDQLLEYPPNCEYNRFTLILAQHRHLHTHMGMIMGFVIDDTKLWPRVLGLETPFPSDSYSKYF
ncbi:MAG: hypothetical protein KIC73_14925 [Clostridiales bacterium]|nr:hypothetical protein [Clostridiales bacterium]